MQREPFDGEVPAEEADFLIVGGGAAGCALAARLSEDPHRRVVLVEAGPDMAPGAVPDEIRSGYPGRAFFTRSFFFAGLTAFLTDIPGAVGPRRSAAYEQARVLGGGSSINGMVGNRGSPADYDEWAALGAEGWAWQDVLPFFRKLERDLDFAGPFHGEAGPITIRRLPRDQLTAFVDAACRALRARGFAPVEDQNAEWRDGVTRVAVTMDEDGHRVSAATGYLTDAVRARPNLALLTETSVTRLRFDGRRCAGAEATRGGAAIHLGARQTVLCAGAVHSPAILMRSGVGPAAELSRHGVAPLADVAGVGRGLREHPALGISCFLKKGARLATPQRHHTQAHLRFSSGIAGCPPSDLYMALLARSAWHALGEQLATFYLWINKPFSQGSVVLASADPLTPPVVDLRLLSDPLDLARMRFLFRTFAELALSRDLDAVRTAVIPTVFSDRVRRISRPSRWNALQCAALAAILDLAGPLRDGLIRRLIAGVDLTALLADESALDAYLAEAVVGVWHPCGTCRMGRADDPGAVTDASGRVRGIGCLRVADASIMPQIPRANLSLPSIMVGERAAALIAAEELAGCRAS